MGEPISTFTAVGWGMQAVGSVVSPVLSNVIQEAYAVMKIDGKEKLNLLNMKIVQLEIMLTLGESEIGAHKRMLDPVLNNLKVAFYEAEEFLDGLNYHRLSKEAQEFSSGKSNMGSKLQKWVQKQGSWSMSNDDPPGLSKKKLQKVLDRIEGIINEAYRILEWLNLQRTSFQKRPESSVVNLRTTGIPKAKVFGRDEECDSMVARLHDPEGNNILGIYGITGSGKTTLAQAVFFHEQQAGYFDICIWLHISQDFSFENIKRDFVLALGQKATHCNLSNFEQLLMDKLQDKRYLLVLDDLCYLPRDADCSARLVQLLPPETAGKKGSKVLVTSRSAEAAIVLGATKESCFVIRDLQESSFQELLMHYALGDSVLDETELGKFKEIGARIATKLKRSPLSARVIGAQLYVRQDIDFWKRTENRDLIGDLAGSLWWSYIHLSVRVRRCIAFCGIFPRRQVLYRDEIIDLWIAAGLIKGTPHDDLEAVANDYFEDLVSISFFQRVPGLYQKRNYYIVHNILHDMAIQVAGSDVFTFERDWTGLIPHNTRHLWVDNGSLVMDGFASLLKHLQTLIIVSEEINLNESIFTALSSLRILKIPTCGLPRVLVTQPSVSTFAVSVPESIANLIHLRYLAFVGELRRAEIHFTKKFAKMYHLEVLEFEYNSSVVFNWGSENVCFSNLRRLSGSGTLDVPHIGRARSLQTLSCFAVKDEPGFEFKQLHDLDKLSGRLRIVNLENVRSKETAVEGNLSSKINLKGLVLEWTCRAVLQTDIDVETEVLYSLSPPTELEELKILHYSGSPYPLWLVDKQDCLKCLRLLHIQNAVHTGPGPNLSYLTCLESLTFEVCGWSSLPSGLHCLTKLRSLTLGWCPNIQELTSFPISLEQINIRDCNTSLMISCKEIGHPNWMKIRNIPTKDISVGSGRHPPLKA